MAFNFGFLISIAIVSFLAGCSEAFTQFSEAQLRATGLKDPSTGYPIYLPKEKDDRYDLMARWRLHKIFVTELNQQTAKAAQEKVEAELKAAADALAKARAEAEEHARQEAEKKAAEEEEKKAQTPRPKSRSKVRELLHLGRRYILGRQ